MIEITPLETTNTTLKVPGSKSLTQRALVAASLADGVSRILDPLESEDTQYSSAALMQMGVKMEKGAEWVITGNGGKIAESDKPLFLGNNGTATRFLTSVAALGKTLFTIDGGSRMHQRPIEPLMSALQGWGVDIKSIRNTGW